MHKLSHLRPRIDGALFGTVSVLVGCGGLTGPADQPVRLSALSVESLRPGVPQVIQYRVENLSTRRVFILACGDRFVAELEQRAGSAARWVPAEAAVRCPADRTYLPIVLEARSIGEGNITAPGAGVYRLVAEYQVDRPSGRRERVVSGPISVSRP